MCLLIQVCVGGYFLSLVVKDTAWDAVSHLGRAGDAECVATSVSLGQFILHPVGSGRKELGKNGSALWHLLSCLDIKCLRIIKQ